jgi:hypothetical protein
VTEKIGWKSHLCHELLLAASAAARIALNLLVGFGEERADRIADRNADSAGLLNPWNASRAL